MTFEEASKYVTNQHIYYDVGVMAVINCPFNKSVTEVNGKLILGTDVPYDAIAEKELHPVT